MSRRIFISHRHGQAGDLEFIRKLKDELGAAGFDVLVDFECLAAGAHLRQDVYTWLGICHAAIVLLSPRALGDDSTWVPTESSILAWRRTLDPNFLLIPVLMPGVGVDDLRNHLRFRDLGLHDLLCIPHVDEASTFDRIQAALQPLRPAPRTPVEELAETIEVKLQGLRQDFLEEVVRLCGADGHELPPSVQGPRAAALALLQAPLERTTDALDYLAPRLPAPHDVERILELVAPGWVDLCAARWVAQSALTPPPKPAVVVNANTQFGAEMFVRRACCRPPKTMWHVVKVTAVVGESAFDDLAMEVQTALQSAFATMLQFSESPAQQLAAVLNRLSQRGHATVVVLRMNTGFQALIPALQQRFPYLTFLFLSGDELPDDDCPTDLLRRVDPSLAPGEEAEAETNYLAACVMLRASTFA